MSVRFLLCVAGPLILATACLGPTTSDGIPGEIVLAKGIAYVALAGDGLLLVEPDSDRTIAPVAVPEGATRADDLAVENDALFVLDADEGRIWSYTLEDPRAPRLVTSPIEVPVGPFSGISAAKDRLIVSGGTSELTIHRIDGARIVERIAALDLDRGQPDVTLHADARIAIVSTHFDDEVSGAEFGLTALVLADDGTPAIASRAGLMGAGFTEGVAQPSNFPIQGAFKGKDFLVAFGGGIARFEVDAAGVLNTRAVLALGTEGTAVAIDGDTAFVVGAGDTPRLVEVDLGGGGLAMRRTIELDEDAVPLGCAANSKTILVSFLARPIARFSR